MTQTGTKPLVLGFMSVRASAGGPRGGYLLTTEYGRPIEFHYTSEVVVTPQQRILYGPGYERFLYGELIGKALTERQGAAPRLIVVDRPELLELRRHIPAPVVYLEPLPTSADHPASSNPNVRVLGEFPHDDAAFQSVRSLAPTGFDWDEPIERVRLALAEIPLDIQRPAA
jgi:hypothetical protein